MRSDPIGTLAPRGAHAGGTTLALLGALLARLLAASALRLLVLSRSEASVEAALVWVRPGVEAIARQVQLHSVAALLMVDPLCESLPRLRSVVGAATEPIWVQLAQALTMVAASCCAEQPAPEALVRLADASALLHALFKGGESGADAVAEAALRHART